MLDFCRFLYLFSGLKEIHCLASKFPICFVAFKGTFLFYGDRVYTNWVPRVLKLWVFQWVITAECKCSSSEPLVTFYDQQPENCLLQLPTRIANMRDLNWCPFVFTLHSKVHWFPMFALDSCSAKTWHEFRLFHWYQRWMTTRWQVTCVEIWTTPFRQGHNYICLPFILECNTVDAAPVITLGLF
jgi:hypothetical protein